MCAHTQQYLYIKHMKIRELIIIWVLMVVEPDMLKFYDPAHVGAASDDIRTNVKFKLK